MGGALPTGEPVPDDGALPPEALLDAEGRQLAAYLHVPFCATRCGYCDFNTYTASELGAAPGTAQASYVEAVLAETRLARRVLGDDTRPFSTVFVGGGTPTLLPSEQLVRLLAGLVEEFGLAAGAEVTTEANPESVTPDSLGALVAGGFTRVSFGMQSAVPHVLATLDRVHTPGRALGAVADARAAGFASVSLDLIYGTPGESLADFEASLEAALSAEPDHVSAYALIVEEGTDLARRIRRGLVSAPDDDDLADKYELAERMLSSAGLDCYELSNWARPGHECRHNLAYWRSDDWWGFGPGAHSHIGGTRWWNQRHPRSYAERLQAGRTPAAAREVLSDEDRRVERVLLELRLRDGVPLDVLTASERQRVPGLVGGGLVSLATGRLVLTAGGRLLADRVVRDLLD